MLKRTNSILEINENHYISSFINRNIGNNYISNIKFYKSKNIIGKKYNISIYYNGIINRIFQNHLVKRNVAMTLNKNSYNP